MAIKWPEVAAGTQDERRVVLIKSLATNNRFYALVDPASGIRNADTVERIPEELVLGVAYPCLEDGLNDFAVIRTTYETLDLFPDDEEMRHELMQIVTEARGKLCRRLAELRDRIASRSAFFLGTDLEEFKTYALDIMQRGYPRRNLDSMMKLSVFSAVAEAEVHANGSEPLYHYEYRDQAGLHRLPAAPARAFVSALFGDVLDSVLDEANYASRYTFDRNVFQKFIALMFVNYATTDPIFYGTNKADYGVSSEREMDQTPLYLAVARELRAIEEAMAGEGAEAIDAHFAGPRAAGQVADRTVQLPGTLVNEDVLLGPLASISANAKQLHRKGDRDASEFSRIILADVSRLVEALKRLGIVSPFAYDPAAPDGAVDESAAERRG
ncbi:MAG: hypothetical protein IT208_09485 [Chthonomonadales bacterium]|nr:hypothetical protein [Chthonomonadales bacterium]